MTNYLACETFVLTTATHGTPVIATMKRYKRASGANPAPREPGYILLFGHGAGFSKEIWEPTIEPVLRLDDAAAAETGGKQQIREAWALDWQSHGEAAIINEHILARKPGTVNIYDYADAFSKLYTSGLLGPLDPEIHKVVLIGHSAGAIGVVLATSFFNPPPMVPFASLILVDLPMYSRELPQNDAYKLAESAAPTRRDIWDSVESARKWLRARLPWSGWDPQVYDVFIKYGLRTLPTAYYPIRTSGVTLKTYRGDEYVAFLGMRHAFDALYRLNQICDFVPVHLVFGARNDLFDREVQDSAVDSKEGRNFASVCRIQGAGHLVPQEQPARLASVIYNILCGGQSTTWRRTKL